MATIKVEILTRAPTEFFHCQHCEIAFHELGIGQRFRAEQRSAALPDDLQQEYGRLVDWARDLAERFGGRVRVEVVDVASIEGFVKALRYRAWRYPTIVVDGEVMYRPGKSANGASLASGLEHLSGRIAELAVA